MPRVARFRIGAIDDLLRQLQYAPPATLKRQMDAAERLVDDVDPRRTYPEDFLVFRITGYRRDPGREPSVAFPGEALLGDLATFVQHVSDRLALPHDADGRRAVPVVEAARRLGVSGKTLQRYRRQGLVCHYVDAPDGQRRLVVFEDALERFRARHDARVERAAAFRRLTDAERDSMIEAARRLRASEAVSLNEAALRLARDAGRAHETVRAVLRRHDRRADPAARLFDERGPLGPREIRLVHRAVRMDVDVARIARRFGRTPATIRRTARRRQAALLRDALPVWIELPTFGLEDAETVILSAPPVRSGLDVFPATRDALALAASLRDAPPPDEETEEALLVAFNLLKRRAAGALLALPAWPGSRALDAIERDLRWAFLLKRRLLALALPAAVGTIEQHLHAARGLESQPTERIRTLLGIAVDVAVTTIDEIDPTRGHGLARRVAHDLDRALSAASARAEERRGRAAARHGPGTVVVAELDAGLAPWQPLVALRPDLVARLPDLAGPAGDALRLYHGTTGMPPLDRVGVAERTGRSVRAVGTLLRAGRRALRAKAAAP